MGLETKINFNELFVQSERTSLELKIESLQSKLNAPIGLLTIVIYVYC